MWDSWRIQTHTGAKNNCSGAICEDQFGASPMLPPTPWALQIQCRPIWCLTPWQWHHKKGHFQRRWCVTNIWCFTIAHTRFLVVWCNVRQFLSIPRGEPCEMHCFFGSSLWWRHEQTTSERFLENHATSVNEISTFEIIHNFWLVTRMLKSFVKVVQKFGPRAPAAVLVRFWSGAP